MHLANLQSEAMSHLVASSTATSLAAVLKAHLREIAVHYKTHIHDIQNVRSLNLKLTFISFNLSELL